MTIIIGLILIAFGMGILAAMAWANRNRTARVDRWAATVGLKRGPDETNHDLTRRIARSMRISR